jgi:hypothetical protein
VYINELPATTVVDAVHVGAVDGARRRRTLFALVLPPLPFILGTEPPSLGGAMDGRGGDAA